MNSTWPIAKPEQIRRWNQTRREVPTWCNNYDLLS